MKLRWTAKAAADLEGIADSLIENAPAHAARLVNRIYGSIGELPQFPLRGRPGRVTGTREYVLPHLPYVVVYTANDKFIHIVRILHGAQKWP